jgi:hypothetical protein
MLPTSAFTKRSLKQIGFNKINFANPDTLATTPEILVQQQVDAYNTKNIDAFLATYADSIELYDFPCKLLSKGKETMQQHYGKLFHDFPELHCTIKERIVNGNTVIDHESISGIGNSNNIEAVAIYETENDKIVKVWFIK